MKGDSERGYGQCLGAIRQPCAFVLWTAVRLLSVGMVLTSQKPPLDVGYQTYNITRCQHHNHGKMSLCGLGNASTQRRLTSPSRMDPFSKVRPIIIYQSCWLKDDHNLWHLSSDLLHDKTDISLQWEVWIDHEDCSLILSLASWATSPLRDPVLWSMGIAHHASKCCVI